MDKDKAAFAQLQREFRHLKLNRKSYADESYQVLRKQQATIGKLRKENEALKQELSVESRRHMMKPCDIEERSKKHEELEKLRVLETDELKRVRDLEAEIVALREKTLQQRKDMGGINAAREQQAMVNKQIRILENRLDQALVKFNQALAKNKELRQDIDDLRRERVVFDNIYRKLERDLHDKKRQMANVIELSNVSYEQRDNYQMEIAAIEQANRKEQDEFEAQMLELNRVLETELVIPPLPVLSQKSFSSEPSELTRQKRASKPKPPGSSSSKDKQDLQKDEERVQNFEEAFNRIKAATGVTDVDELVRTFVKNEEQNFSLFNYVNEQTNEIEKLEEEIQQLRDEEHKYTQESGQDVNQHKLIVDDLQAKIRDTESQADKYQAKCDEYQTIIDSLKECIAACFSKLDCPPANKASDNLLAAVTEANMLPYLAIIEERINELIKKYATIKSRQAKAAASAADPIRDVPVVPSVLGIGPTTPMGQELIHVNPPKLEDYSSEEDDDDDEGETRPLTRDELKAKTLNRMYRRVNNRDGSTQRGAHKKLIKAS